MFEWAGQEDSQSTGWLHRRYRAFVEQRDRDLIERLKKSESLKPTFTFPKLLAILFSVPIHVVTFALPLLGIALIVSQIAGYVSLCCGLILLGVAWVVRPRFGKTPEDVVPREKFPALYQLADDVANALKAAPVDAIAMDEYFSAGYERFGLRRSRLLILGYPMWQALDPQERVALLAHELAHDVNGDLSRSFFVGSAIDSLVNWYLLLVPDRGTTVGGLGGVVGRMVVSVIAELILLCVFFMGQLLLYERRRAEYLADYLSAQVAGTEAAISMLEKLKGRGRRYVPLQRRSHPPIEYRIEFLKGRPTMLPAMALSTPTSEKIDEELAALEREMHRRIEQSRNEGRYY